MRTGFAAAGGGSLLPYHLGVLDSLQYHGYLTPDTPLAGASAGAIAVAAKACDIDSKLILDDTIGISESCIAMGGPRGNQLPLIREKLENRIDEGRFQTLSNRPGDTVVSYYELFPSLSSIHESRFDTKEDVVDALCHSASFPFFASHWPCGFDFRKNEPPSTLEVGDLKLTLPEIPRMVVDGFFAVPPCRFGCPDFSLADKSVDKVDRTILITPFAPIRLNKDIAEEDIICPPMIGFGLRQTAEVLRSSIQPSPAKKYMNAYEAGHRDAERWVANESALKVGDLEMATNVA